MTLSSVLAAEVREAKRKAANEPSFRGAAQAMQEVTDHEAMLSGPAETGKTLAACVRLDAEMWRNRGATAAIIRQVRADMRGTVLRTWQRVIDLKGGVESLGGENPELYRYPNGSKVYVVGMDRPGAVLSGEFDALYVNQAEELKLEAWEYLSTRCTGRGAVTKTPMLFGDCNPGPPNHWILKRPSLRLLHSRHEDNPTLYTDTGQLTEQGRRTLAVLDSLTGVRKERLRYGRWTAAEGVVYEAFDRGIHVIDSFRIPDDWRRVCAIDFGFSNPFVCLWGALDPDGRLYLYRELYRTRTIVEDHAAVIKRLTGRERIEAYVADHDAEDRATLARHGIHTTPAVKAVASGIQLVQERLRVAPDGKPRLFVFSDCLAERDESLAAARKPTSIVEEFETYSWPKDAGGKSIKEAPVKIDDHAMDGLRYLCAYLDSGAVSPTLDYRTDVGERAVYGHEDDFSGGGWGDERTRERSDW